MQPGDRLICAFIEPQPIGHEFKKWLLHVTIVPWMRLDDSSELIARGLQTALLPIKPFKVGVDKIVHFGPKRNRPAHLLEAGSFPEIEQRVRNYLHKKRAWLVDETTKAKRVFRPHVTFQGDEHLGEGDSIACDRLYIVEQRGEYKVIVAEVPLGSSAA